MKQTLQMFLSVFGGGKYEKYFKYINTHNLSSFYCDRNNDYSDGINSSKSCICCYAAYNFRIIRYYQIHCP